jgi:hypothetical protein
LKWSETLKTIIFAWKDFAKTELERQVCDFATNLAMDSSQGSAFLSTSGYQTSLKNSSSSFQFLPADEEVSVVFGNLTCVTAVLVTWLSRLYGVIDILNFNTFV